MYWVVTKKLFFSLILCKLFSFIMLLTWSAVVYHNSFLRENLEVEHLRRMWRLLSATWLLLWLKKKQKITTWIVSGNTNNESIFSLLRLEILVNWNYEWQCSIIQILVANPCVCGKMHADSTTDYDLFWVKRFVLIFVHVQ